MASAWVFIQIYVYALIQNPAAKWPVVRKSQTPATGKKNEYFGQPGLSNDFTKEEHFLVSETISISILKLYSLETMTIVIMSTPTFWG